MNIWILIGDEAPFSGREVVVFGFTAFVMVLVVVDALFRGKIRIKGITARRFESPFAYWMGVCLALIGMLIAVAAYVFMLTQWLGR